jgi:predicted Holliday junction resolvase-like endonuclease
MNVDHLIKNLRSSNLVAQCPLCDEQFKLSDALLFDGMGKFPKPAEEKKLLLLKELKEREDELKRRKISADVIAEKKAIEVGFGTIIEKFIPAYKNLKLQFCECRPLYEPIDLVVFNGLLKRKVDLITFLEIKSGNSKLNNHQRMIRDAVFDKKVDLRVLG